MGIRTSPKSLFLRTFPFVTEFVSYFCTQGAESIASLRLATDSSNLHLSMSSHDQVITGLIATMTHCSNTEHHHQEHVPRVSIPNDQEFEGASPENRLLARAKSQSVSKRAKLSEKALEAKRKTNRQSARRCRLRQKLLVKELQEKNALLTMKNTNLMLKLELSQAENRKLRLMQNQETKLALKRNQELQELHSRVQRQIRDQQAPPPLPPQTATTASALLELASAPTPLNPETIPNYSAYRPTSLEESRARVRELKEQLLHQFPMLPSLQSRRMGDVSSDVTNDVLRTQTDIHSLQKEVAELRAYLARRKSSI